jgi:competence ComEA-like helix-hairpin-helix protein
VNSVRNRVKLTAPEAKAVKFVLLLIAVSAVARWLNRGERVSVEPAMQSTTESFGPAVSRRRAAPPGVLDPNMASLSELDALPGIGPATAKRIVAARPLRDVNDLARAVGRKRALEIAPRLRLRTPVAAPVAALPIDLERLNASQLSLNRATNEELERLSGVGPALARRLIAARDSLHGFRDWSQVDAIPGIGPSLLKKLKDKTSL